MKMRIVLLLSCVLLLNGCATTEVLNVWKEEGRSGKINKLFVVGVIKESAYRKVFEQKLVSELQRNGVNAVPTFDLFGVEEQPEKDEVMAFIKQHGVDGLLIVRLVDSEKFEVYTPGATVMVSNSYNAGWYGYYGGSYSVYNTPGRTYDYRELTAETVIFELGKDKPVWSAVTRTTEQKKYESIESYIKGIRPQLLASGLF